MNFIKNLNKYQNNYIPLIFFLSIFSLLGAILTQKIFDLYPCTYCIVARYVLSMIGLFSILSIFFKNLSTDKSLENSTVKPKNKIFHKLSLLMSFMILINICVGIYFSVQHYIVVFKNDFTCGRDLLQDYLNHLTPAKTWPYMFEATGGCVDANYKLFNFISYVHLPMIIYISMLLMIITYFYNIIKNK